MHSETHDTLKLRSFMPAALGLPFQKVRPLTWDVRQASHWLHLLRRLAAAAPVAARAATAAWYVALSFCCCFRLTSSPICCAAYHTVGLFAARTDLSTPADKRASVMDDVSSCNG